MPAAVSSIVDRENGLGADVNLADGVDSADIVVHVAQYTGAWSNLTFATSGTILDISTIRLALGNGAYIASIVEDGVPNGVYGFRVSDGSLSIHKRCLDAVRAHVLALALAGVDSDGDRHVIHSRPIYSLRELGDDPDDYSGVHYWPLPERRTPADNVRDDVVFPAQVAWVRGNGGTQVIDDVWLMSREVLSKSYDGCPFADVDEINQVETIPAALYDASGAILNVDVQSLIFDCHTQQARQVV